jgi:hypothetical protein
MAAVFEVHIFSKSLYPYDKYMSIGRCFNSDFTLEEVTVMDNWEFEGQKGLPLDENISKTIIDHVADEKIIMASGQYGTEHNGGFRCCQERGNIYAISIWISSKHMPYLDGDRGPDNEHIYHAISNFIADEFGNDFILCGLGTECSIEYSGDVAETMKSSHNVYEWVLPK